MSPLLLNNICPFKKYKSEYIDRAPSTCPIKKKIPKAMDDTTTKCSSNLGENESSKNNKKFKIFRLYECEDVFPKNTLESDTEILHMKANKRILKKFSFTVISEKNKFGLQPSRSILQLLKEKSSE